MSDPTPASDSSDRDAYERELATDLGADHPRLHWFVENITEPVGELFLRLLLMVVIPPVFSALVVGVAGDLQEKGTDLHAATVVGDTVGDPFKDTSSVSMNPIIKFTTLFGLLAVELAIEMDRALSVGLTIAFFVLACTFVWRSFYAMRSRSGSEAAHIEASELAAAP